MRRLTPVLILFIFLTSCGGTPLGPQLGQKTIAHIKSLGLLEEGEEIELFYSQGNYKQSGGLITSRRMANYWLDDRDSTKNDIRYGRYEDIISIDTFFNVGLTYSPYLEVTRKDSSTFKVYVEGERKELLAFYEKAIECWKKSSTGTSPSDSPFPIHDLFKSENSDVVNAMAGENYGVATKKAIFYLNDPKTVLTEIQKANLRYMHVYALAGLVTQKTMKRSDLKKVLDSYIGQELITQHLPVTKGNAMPFNQIQVEQDEKESIKITCANNEGINIHCFVNVKMENPFDLEKLVGKNLYLKGKLTSYKLSDDDVYSWIVTLNLEKGTLIVLEDEFEKK